MGRLIMKHNDFLLNTLLAGIVGLALLICMLVRTFFPAAVLPRLDVPMLVLLSLAALLAESYLAPGANRRYLPVFAFAALTFGLLPPAAGMGEEVWKTALAGGIVFTAVTALFTSALSRISSGTPAGAAPLISAAGIFLAVQALTGILL